MITILAAASVFPASQLSAKNFNVRLSGAPQRGLETLFAKMNKCIAKKIESSDKAKFKATLPNEKVGDWDIFVTTRLLAIPSADGKNPLGYVWSSNILVDAAAGAETEQKIPIFRDLKQLSLPRADAFSPERLTYFVNDTMGVLPEDFDFDNDNSRISPCAQIAEMIDEQSPSLEKMSEWAKRNIGNELKGEK